MIEYKFTASPNICDDDVGKLYDTMAEGGYADALFYDGGLQSKQDWMNFIAYDQNWLVQCEHPVYGIVGVWWLNCFIGRSAMIHFCMLGKELEANIEICKQSMKWLANNYNIKSLYGLTPIVYRHVWPLIEAVGFKRTGKLQGACCMAYHGGKLVDGVISTLDLKQYVEEAD